MFSDKLVIYREPAIKLTIAALVNLFDNTALIKSLLIKTINEFYDINKDHIKNDSYNIKVKKNEASMKQFVSNLFKKNTLKRDRSKTTVAFFISLAILLGFIIGLTNFFLGILATNFLYMKTIFNSLPANFHPFNINFANSTFTIIGGLSTLFGILVVYLVGGLSISALIFGYLSGTRKNSVKKGTVLFIIEVIVSSIVLIIIDPGNYFLILFYLIFASMFFLIPLLGGSYLCYFGGVLRERSKLYDIPEGQKFKKIDEMPNNF